jgi:hypothetical protein
MTLTKLWFVVLLAAPALPWPSSVHAQQPQAQQTAAVPQVDLSGRWRFGTFGSFWTVDLKLEPSKTADDEKVYCGDATRDRRMPDTPIVKARLCAEIDPDDKQLHAEVSGATCKALFRSVGILDGTCSRSGAMAMSLSVGKDGDATADMATPMGGFTAMRVAAGTKK